MRMHRTRKPEHVRPAIGCLPRNLPSIPDNVGKTRTITAIDGRIRTFRIEDEIIRPQSNNDRKIIDLQKVRFIEEDRIEFRFAYYMIGRKGKTTGKWVWGQFCLFIPQEDLVWLLQEARTREWF
jgi:hypothetical protein